MRRSVALEIPSQAHLATHTVGGAWMHAVLTRNVSQAKVVQINVSGDCGGTIRVRR
jgi:hypothetical protein